MSIREYMQPKESGVMFMADLLRDRQPEPHARAGAKGATIYEKVRLRKQQLEDDRFRADEWREKIAAVQRKEALCTKRHQTHQRLELERERQQLEDEYASVRSGQRIDLFNETARPYLHEFQRQQFCRPANAGADAANQSPINTSLVMAEYMINVEGDLPKFDIQGQDACEGCQEAMQLYQAYALLICPRCGRSKEYLDATASLLAYSDDYDYCSFSYKRINHFSEWLASIQAKETLDIPQHIMDMVMERLTDERLTDMQNVTVHKVREILKKLKLRKYYEHVQLITCKLTGRSPPRMTPEMEEKIKVCFLAASAAFQRHCPPDRKNMISYQLVLLKLCELLGYHDFVPYFMLLKGKDKLTRMDVIWKKICEDLDWTYIPSVP